MSCQHREQDVLLLVHDELRGIRRLLTEAHLRHCPRCQEQKARYTSVSRSLASVLRAPGSPRWVPPGAARALPEVAEGIRWPLVLSLVLLLTALTVGTLIGLPPAAALLGRPAFLPAGGGPASCHDPAPAAARPAAAAPAPVAR